METWRTGKDFRQLIESDPEIRARVKHETIANAFDLERQLRYADAIIDRALA
jgi:adenylosuccinate lyase